MYKWNCIISIYRADAAKSSSSGRGYRKLGTAETRRLDDLYLQGKLGSTLFGAMKVDVGGFESRVLFGGGLFLTSKDAPRCVHYHYNRLRRQGVVRALRLSRADAHCRASSGESRFCKIMPIPRHVPIAAAQHRATNLECEKKGTVRAQGPPVEDCTVEAGSASDRPGGMYTGVRGDALKPGVCRDS